MLRTLGLVTSIVFIAGCIEDEQAVVPIKNDQAAELIATTVSSGTFGLNTVLDQIISFTNENSIPSKANTKKCGDMKNIGYILENQPAQQPTFYYSFEYAWTKNCISDQNISSLDVGLSYTGEFDDPDRQAEYGGTGILRMKLLQNDMVHFEGNFGRSHKYQLKSEDEEDRLCNVQLSVTDLMVRKTTRQIKSGRGAITLTGSTNDGNYTMEGTILFNGNNSAVVTINKEEYFLNLQSGDMAHYDMNGSESVLSGEILN